MRANGLRRKSATSRAAWSGRVRRIGQHQVERPRRQPLGEAQGIAPVHGRRLLRRRARRCSACSALSEGGFSSTNVAASAPRESASRPSAPLPGEEIEHPRAGELIAEDAHPRFTHPVGGGAHPRILRHDQAAPAELPRDDSQGREGRERREGWEGREDTLRQSLPVSCPPFASSRSVGRQRAQPRLQRDHPIPLVALDAERRVHQVVSQPGHPVGPLEADDRDPGACRRRACP